MHALKKDFVEDTTSLHDMSDQQIDDTSQTEKLETLSSAFAHISNRITTLAVNIADTSGTVGDVTSKLTDQVASLTQLLDSVEALEGRNQTISKVANETIERASHVHEGLATATNAIEQIFTVASDDIKRMSTSTTATIEAFGDIKSELSQVHSYSESIQKISTQTRMLAINAGVMAAHAGSAGKGFGVVAESVSELSDETASVSANIIKRLGNLEKTISRLLDHSQKSYDVATDALGRAESTNEEFRKFREFGEEVDNLVTSVSNMADPLAANNEACIRVLNDLRIIDSSSNENFNQLKATSGKFDDLVSFTEDMVLLLEESGVETEDSQVISDCIENANLVAQIFENAIASGRVSVDDLFDEQYVPIAGTNPEQVMTRFTEFTDAHLVEIQEAFKNKHARVAFCAAVDRNGYLPTHNLIYSQPQSNDPTWNAGNCRNRRIFNDRTGLAAGQNTNPFIMQTYRRDMGGGNFVMMKDLSVPIFVLGRHWGGLRAGVSVS